MSKVELTTDALRLSVDHEAVDDDDAEGEDAQ
jgi:hypothetical protein